MVRNRASPKPERGSSSPYRSWYRHGPQIIFQPLDIDQIKMPRLHFDQFGRKVEYGKIVVGGRLAVLNAGQMTGDDPAQLRAA